MEQFKDLIASLSLTFTQKCKDYECVLEEELSKRENTHALELQKVRKELESLQQQLAKADVIEHENVRLRSEIGNATTHAPWATKKFRFHDEEIFTTKDLAKLERPYIDLSEPSILLMRENGRLSALLQEEKEQSARLHRAIIKLKDRCKMFKDENLHWKNYLEKLKLELAKGKSIGREEQQRWNHSVKGNSRTRSASHSSNHFECKPLSSEGDSLTPALPTGTPTDTFNPVERALHSTDRCISTLTSQPSHREVIGDAQLSGRICLQDSLDVAKNNSSETCSELHSQDFLPSKPHIEVEVTTEKPEFVVDDESDVPVVVSERSLKRKRRRTHDTPDITLPENIMTGLGSVTKPISVKSEQCSSSPSVPTGLALVDYAHDSLDLDEIRHQTFTPRKKKRAQQVLSLSQKGMLSRTSHLDILRFDKSASSATTKFVAQNGPTNRSESTSVPSRNRLEKQSLYNQRAHERQSRLDCDRSESIKNETEASISSSFTPLEKARSEPADAIRSQHSIAKPSGVQLHRLTVLQPTTPNAKVLPRTFDSEASFKGRKRENRQGRGELRIPYVAEDGQDSSSTRSARSSYNAVNPDRPMAPRAADLHSRLGHLLTEPSPEKPPLCSIKKTSEISSKARNAGQIPDASNSLELSRVNILPERGNLRARPLDCLGLDDFRINPISNQGIDFAFNEVIRNQDQRKCMPNCTRSGCCGDKFRKLVEIGGLPIPFKSSLWTSSPTQDDNEERRLLEGCLGIHADRLCQMSESTKQELLIEAKAKYFATELGKHKQNYERKSTPPGFWRTDMPTTQEADADREIARRVERQRVEERYRGAMRAEGRWKFRDE